MNNISSDDAFSVLNKWREEGAILQLGFKDTETGEFRSFWVLVSRVIPGGSPSLILSDLSEPFPFLCVYLKGAKFKYGDHREFREGDDRSSAERGWVRFLLLSMPKGTEMILSELRRDLPLEYLE